MSDMGKESSLTVRRIRSPKWVLFAGCALAAVTDIFVLALLGAGGFAGKYFVCPALLLAFDLLFLAGILLTNFRFRYSVLEVVLYVFAVAVLTALTAAVNMYGGKEVAITTWAAAGWLAVHGMLCVCVIASALYAAKIRKFVKSGAAITFCALLAAVCCFYAAFITSKGFFGQGVGGGLRTLSFSYSQEEGYYCASGVLSGSGDTVVVPETFNGKQVGAIDCGIFAAKGVKNVRFSGEADIELTNTAALASVNEGLSIYTDKEKVDDFRNKFYRLSGVSSLPDACIALANNTFPEGLSDGEIYVAFDYDAASYEIAEGNVLPVWFGVKGEAFSLQEYYEQFPCFAHADSSSADDLHWNYLNSDGYIAEQLTDGSGAALEGRKLTESVQGVKVRFEKIYTLSIGADNDSLYESDESYKITVLEDGTRLPYLYTVASRAEEITGSLPARSGFTLGWTYAREGGQKKSLTDLAAVLVGEGGDVTIYPEWSLDAPEVTLVSDKAGGKAVYGQDVLLTAAASSDADGVSFRYEWRGPRGTDLYGSERYELDTPAPSESGQYVVAVTAYSDTTTSLTAQTEKSILLEISKKQVTFTWDIPEGAEAVYSAQDKPVLCTLDEGQEVGGDTIGFALSQNSVRNAGVYLIKVVFDGESAEKYEAASGSGERTVTVVPYEVSVSWSSSSFVYDGQAHVPSASAMGVGADGALSLSVFGEGINAGAYTARASLADGNYTLSDPDCSFTIEKRPITVSAWEEKTLYYNGKVQYPSAVSLQGTVSGEENLILGNYLRYSISTGGMNAGEHTVRVTLGECNYLFETPQTFTYTISRAQIVLSWGQTRVFTYDGREKSLSVAAVTGAVNGEAAAVLASLEITGGAADAGKHTMQASLPSMSNYEIVGGATCEYTVEKRDLTISFNDVSKTYDGKAAEYTYRTDGLASGDSLADVLTLIPGGSALQAKDAGSYSFDATYEAGAKAGNYNIVVQSASLTISRRAVSVTWDTTRNFVYNGKEQYVRAAGIVGAVSGEEQTVLGLLVYAGKGVDAGNYTVSVTLPGECNYRFDSVQECAYTVSPRQLTLSWTSDDFVFVYDGGGKSPEASCGESGVAIEYEYFTANGVSIGSVPPTEVGEYRVTANIREKNYTAEGIVHEFSIVGEA